MDILLAFIGAIIGSFVSVQYMYVTDNLKVRREAMLEVVVHYDNIYHLIQDMHVRKNAIYARDVDELDEDYTADSQQLSILLKTIIPHTKLAIAYGEGEALHNLNQLSSEFRKVVSILRNATRTAWAIENKEIFSTFESTIDPLKIRLHQNLLSGAKRQSIWQILASK